MLGTLLVRSGNVEERSRLLRRGRATFVLLGISTILNVLVAWVLAQAWIGSIDRAAMPAYELAASNWPCDPPDGWTVDEQVFRRRWLKPQWFIGHSVYETMPLDEPDSATLPAKHVIEGVSSGFPFHSMKVVEAVHEWKVRPRPLWWEMSAYSYSNLPLKRNHEISVLARGIRTGSIPNKHVDGIARLPLLPIWPGFVANTLAYAMAFGAVWWSISGVRRWRRSRRGCCGSCGYARAGLDPRSVCPECGSSALAHASASRRTLAA